MNYRTSSSSGSTTTKTVLKQVAVLILGIAVCIRPHSVAAAPGLAFAIGEKDFLFNGQAFVIRTVAFGITGCFWFPRNLSQ